MLVTNAPMYSSKTFFNSIFAPFFSLSEPLSKRIFEDTLSEPDFLSMAILFPNSSLRVAMTFSFMPVKDFILAFWL